MASSSGSPCAACKFLRRKCTAECVFAPYFPPDQPHKFANVHKIFGASNITKLLNELPAHKREDAVNSLAYEADWRMRDPVYGCVGTISILQAKLQRLVCDLHSAHAELARYTGMVPNGQAPLMQPSTPAQQQMNLVDLGMGNLGLHNQQDPTYSQALLEQQQLPHYAREQWAEIVRLGNGSYEAGLAALGVNPNIVASGGGGGAPSPMSTSGLYNSYQRTGTSDGASRSSGGSLGHLSPQ